MKLRKSLPVKCIAFLLAVLCLAGCAALACLQIMEIDVLWGSEPATSSRLVHRMMTEDFGSINYMISLRQTADRNALQEEQLKELESRFAAENTNLYWQIRRSDDSLLWGNTEAELPAAAYRGYWSHFDMYDPVSITNTAGNWSSYAAAFLPAEELPPQLTFEDFFQLTTALADEAARWQAGDRSADPDTVYLVEDGSTDLLLIETINGMTAYAPTLRSVLETNEWGYRYFPGSGGWTKTGTVSRTMILWLKEDLPVDDEYKEAVLTVQHWHANRVLLLIATASAALAWLLLTICLCVWSGWRKGHEDVSLCWFHRIPGDLLLACYIFLGALLIFGVGENAYYIWEQNAIPLRGQLTIAGLFGGGAAILLTSFLITLCARCKGRVVLRNMIVVRILTGCWWAVKTAVTSLPLIWKAALGCLLYLGISFLLWVAVLDGGGAGWVIIWGILSLLAAGYLCWWALCWRRIRKGTEDIMDGFVDRMDTGRMPSDLKEHAAELNNLGEKISSAVEDRMRSEHFKAELITNVSHDLKTPLTSIISYVDLLKKEDIDNPRAAEYIEVLDRKSQRLKKLTEDLVEASKASTGNLTVLRERLDLVQLVDQALAEYQERLESRRLSIVRTLPAEPVWVRGDGRHLWRIVDNLLSNCAKYALEGTRVYAEVEEFFDCAELRIKNISRDALNVKPDELMERFVRGEESRTTEGSGLGLSIAQSLTDLQEGQFHISIDGDLFKATVRLPLAE